MQYYINYAYNIVRPSEVLSGKTQELLDKADIAGKIYAVRSALEESSLQMVGNGKIKMLITNMDIDRLSDEMISEYRALIDEINSEASMLSKEDRDEVLTAYNFASVAYVPILKGKLELAYHSQNEFHIEDTLPSELDKDFNIKDIQDGISLELARTAAKYWAHFLPLDKDVCFGDINRNSKIDDQKLVGILSILPVSDVTEYERDQFIEVLSQKIIAKKFSGYFEKYIHIGDSSSYYAPIEVAESMEEVGIYAMMPFKTEMKIYADNHITVNDKDINIVESFLGCVEDKSYNYKIKIKELFNNKNPHTRAGAQQYY